MKTQLGKLERITLRTAWAHEAGEFTPWLAQADKMLYATPAERMVAAIGEAELVEEVPTDFAGIAMPNGHLAPNLAKQGIAMVRYPRADVARVTFEESIRFVLE